MILCGSIPRSFDPYESGFKDMKLHILHLRIVSQGHGLRVSCCSSCPCGSLREDA
jgi:hypothetical protein